MRGPERLEEHVALQRGSQPPGAVPVTPHRHLAEEVRMGPRVELGQVQTHLPTRVGDVPRPHPMAGAAVANADLDHAPMDRIPFPHRVDRLPLVN